VNKDFLLNYHEDEMSILNDYKKKLLSGQVDPENYYPTKKRFKNINEPMAFNAPFEKIWPQVPIFGSLIVKLHPTRKDQFFDVYGFRVRNIDKIIDFVMDTGKIQFVIGRKAELFEGLEYLEPIFSELKPPYVDAIPLEYFLPLKDVKELYVEFHTIADINFKKYLNDIDLYGFIPNIKTFYDVIEDCAYYYVALKALGFDKIFDALQNYLLYEPSKAIYLFSLYSMLLINPYVHSMNITQSISKKYLNIFSDYDNNFLEKIELPCEIGSFLLNKLTYYPESLDACKAVISEYKQEDMYNVFKALQNGIKLNNIDIIKSKSEELSIILDNVWEDTKYIMKNKVKIQYGITLGLGLIGTLLAGTPGLGIGILTGLGYKILEDTISFRTETISNKLVRKITPNHLCTIFDFKNKYNIK